VEILVR
jgi:hypothetical protein